MILIDMNVLRLLNPECACGVINIADTWEDESSRGILGTSTHSLPPLGNLCYVYSAAATEDLRNKYGFRIMNIGYLIHCDNVAKTLCKLTMNIGCKAVLQLTATTEYIYQWYTLACSKNIYPGGAQLTEKAKMAERLGKSDFKGSRGWLGSRVAEPGGGGGGGG